MTPVADMYNEPTIMWRMQRGDGLSSHAVIGPAPEGAIVVWFVNGRPLGYREFSDLTSAFNWTNQLQAHNWATGWRLVPE